jgi:hypothetical protein
MNPGAAGHEHVMNPGGVGAGQDLLEIRRVFFGIQMAVGVE